MGWPGPPNNEYATSPPTLNRGVVSGLLLRQVISVISSLTTDRPVSTPRVGIPLWPVVVRTKNVPGGRNLPTYMTRPVVCCPARPARKSIRGSTLLARLHSGRVLLNPRLLGLVPPAVVVSFPV